ncbi:Uncharacterized protein OBRU01_24315 [Operophtera brumata]|uniref:Uncharacterized protein n=1 Tax=Operophtera brumata TaxID=104452 RepID=A0A0L7KMR4_OPEBR|nr:Uncharacterized protein OBRU01_24315 [Operophtera brumata]
MGTDSVRGLPELESNNDNVTGESNRNLQNLCPPSFLRQSDKLAASLVKPACDKFGLNELKAAGAEVCLCERYNGGCKLCPRASLTTLALSDGKESCHTCRRSTCATVFTKNI